MGYRVNFIYPDGEEELQDEVFDTEEEAIEAADYLCSCFRQGAEDLALCGRDYDDGDPDYEIIEE